VLSGHARVLNWLSAGLGPVCDGGPGPGTEGAGQVSEESRCEMPASLASTQDSVGWELGEVPLPGNLLPQSREELGTPAYAGGHCYAKLASTKPLRRKGMNPPRLGHCSGALPQSLWYDFPPGSLSEASPSQNS
jgi:hypothetical protein